MLPLEIATEAGRHVRAGLYGGQSTRQVPQPIVGQLVAVEEADTAAVPGSPLAVRLLVEPHHAEGFAPATVAKAPSHSVPITEEQLGNANVA